MALQMSYVGIQPRSIIADSSDIAVALRVTIGTNDLATLSAIGVRGDFVTLQSIIANKAGVAASLQGGGRVPMVASEQTAVGDPAYSAANGQVSKSSGGGAVYLGKWYTATAANAQGEVELASPA